MIYLHEHNIPVARIIRNTRNETYVEENGKMHEVQSYIPHDRNLDHFDFPSVSRDLFAVLGEFHHVSSTYPETIRKSPYLGKTLVPIGHAEKYFRGPQQYGVKRYLAEVKNLKPTQRSQFEKDIQYFMTYFMTFGYFG